MQALDWLAKAVSDMNIKKIGAEHVIALHRGFKEPGFLASDVPDFKTCHPIKEQEKLSIAIVLLRGNILQSTMQQYTSLCTKCTNMFQIQTHKFQTI